ncbi:MAG: Ig-like domain-containing protein, partial [Cyclobacteriaceae bacterium]
MKKAKWMMGLAGLAASVLMLVTVFTGCNDDEPPALTLVSLTANGVDLNGATSATGIRVTSDILATFNVAVDQASTSAITLVRQFDSQNVPVTITVNGNQVTIAPNSDFGTGSLFILNFGAGLKSTEGKTLTAAIERNFTSEGTFAVPGAFAHFTFEDNATDIIGGRTPKA